MNKFGRNSVCLQASELESWDSWPDDLDAPIELGTEAEPVYLPFPKPDASWHVFTVTTRDQETYRLDGFGDWLINDVVRDAINYHKVKPTSADQVVWDGDRVAAILRPIADGGLDVVRCPAGVPGEGGAL